MANQVEQKETISEVIRRELQRRHWSYRVLAEAAGISPAAVGQHVLGRSIPEPSTLKRYAEALGLPFQYLMVIAGHQEPPKENRPADLQIAIETLDSIWSDLPPEVRKLVTNFISELKEVKE